MDKNLVFAIDCDEVLRSTLCNMVRIYNEEIGDNMVDAINSAGYEHSLWEIYDIVGRTTKEEEIAKRERIKSASSDNNE